MKIQLMTVMALMAAWAAFGEAYDPAKHGNPIVVTSGTVDIDGNGTVIDAKGLARCATLGPNVTIRNFVLKNGKAELGGGVYGGKVVNCEITGCRATESAAALCNSVAEGCTIKGNEFANGNSTAAAHGGILFGSMLKNCAIVENIVRFGSEAPAFGGIGERVTLVGCEVARNLVACEENVCYGFRFVCSTVDGKYVEFDDSLKPNEITKVDVDMSGVSFDDASFVADGESHSLVVSGSLPIGVTGVSYSGNGKIEVGVYTVTAKFSVDKYHNPVDDMRAVMTIVDTPPPSPVYPVTPAEDGVVGFCEPLVVTEEGSNVVVRISGGNAGLVSTVQLQVFYVTASAADLDLKKTKVDGIVQPSFKFPYTLTWRAGEYGTRVVEIPVVGDGQSETDEHFTLQLRKPKNARIAGADGGGTNEGVCEVTIRGTKAPSSSQRYARAVANDATRGTVSGSKLCKNGSSVTFAAEAASGYVFVEWLTNGVCAAREASWSFKMPSRDVEATAVFEPVAADYLLFGVVDLPAELKVKTTVSIPVPVPMSLSAAKVKVSGLPDGLSYDSKAHAIVGKPKEASSKASTVTIKVTNLSGFKIVRKYRVTVVKGTPKASRAELVSASEPMNAVSVVQNDELAGKVTGAGIYAAGDKVTLKATAATGCVFAGWEVDGKLKSRKSSWSFTMPSEAVAVKAEFRPVAEDYLSLVCDFLPAELRLGVSANIRMPSAESLSKPTITVSGLPSGLTYKSGKITGKPSQLGKSTVTVSVSNLSGFKIVRKYRITVVNGKAKEGYAKLLSEEAPYYALTAVPTDILAGKTSGTGIRRSGKKATVSATALEGYVFVGWYDGATRKTRKNEYSFTMPAEDVTLTARFVTLAADKASVGASVGVLRFGASGAGLTKAAADVYVGVAVDWKVSGKAETQPSVTVTGLPKGLLYENGRITGVPTVASKEGAPSTVKVKVTTAGGAKKTFSVVLTVKAREKWSRGTYSGKYVSNGVENGTVTLTVGKTGKVSGKIVRKISGKTKTTSFSASSIVSREEDGDGTPAYLVEPTYKSGKKTVKVPFLLQEDPANPGKGVAVGEAGEMELRQE